MDIVELVTDLEYIFKIRLPMEDLEKPSKTVGDLINAVEAKLAKK